jgi:hypothetical protein
MIIYTCITNGYDKISNETYYDPDIRYVCFYDGEIDKVGNWEYIPLDLDITCPVRKSYHPKHLPHHYFDVGEYTMWIDASYTVTESVVDFFKNKIINRHDLVLQRHPAKRNLLEEFSKLYYHGFSSAEECIDMAQKIKDSGFTLDDYDQTINCIVFRKLTDKVNQWSESWRRWYDLGVNRDQVSSSLAEWEVIEAYHIDMIVDMSKSTRVKNYGDSYNLLEKPSFKNFKSFTRKLCKVFNVAPQFYIDKNKMLEQSELKRHKVSVSEENKIDKTKLIVYTCITNDYDDRPKDSFYDPDVRYVCFMDRSVRNPLWRAKQDPKYFNILPWEFIWLPDLGIRCPKRLSTYVKINAHLYFNEGDHVVWVDGCYKLTKEFIEFSLQCFPFTVLRNPKRYTYYDQVFEGFLPAFISYDQVKNFTKKLYEDSYDFIDYSSPMGTVVWRTISNEIVKFNTQWWDYYSTGPNRDPLSLDAAIQKTNVKPLFVDDRNDCGLKLGHQNKVGRLKKHPKEGVVHQWKSRDILLKELEIITGIDSTINMKTKASDHIFYMNYNNVPNDLDKKIRVLPMHVNDPVEKHKMVIYTCITNGYDSIPDENYYDVNVRYVCFHDGTIDTSKGPWEYIDVRKYCDITCPRRLSFFPKANPHIFFPKGTHTVWIDGCYVHTREFVENSLQCFPFTMLRHASKFSYYDEMLEGFLCAFFTYEDALELSQILKDHNYDFRKYSSPLGTIVWRTINEEIIKFNELWYKYSLIGPNRDQISFDAALQFSGSKPLAFENRNDCGVQLGFFNKKGRRGMHPQYGNVNQYKRRKEFLEDLKNIVGLSTKIYTNYTDHEFYMGVYGIQ